MANWDQVPETEFKDKRTGNFNKNFDEETLKKAISETEVSFRDAIYALVVFYSRNNRQNEAKQLIDKLFLITQSEDEKAYYLFCLGQLMEQIKDFHRAVDYYLEALNYKTQNSRTKYFIHNNMGFSLCMLAQFREAEQYCRNAIVIDSSPPNAYKNLGIALEGQNRFNEAAQAYISATHKNVADQRAMNLLKSLISKHPEVIRDDPKLKQEIFECNIVINKFSNVFKK